MELNTKLILLERMIDIYDAFVQEQKLACEKYCAYCCTANVTMTTLEGIRILNQIEKTGDTQWLETMSSRAHPDRFQPRVSINRMADICARDGDPPEEHLNPEAGPCPILTADACPLYAVRPFGCRCMVSVRNCGQTGFAEMDPFILTVNDVFLQHLEHIDARGYTGNFCDVMLFLTDKQNRDDYMAGRLETSPERLTANQPVFVLMVPPEHRERIQPLMQRIRSIQI
jgi:Fe-S-cluster containining protein